MTGSNLAIADRVADGALFKGCRRHSPPLPVAVIDVGGHLPAIKRQDDASSL